MKKIVCAFLKRTVVLLLAFMCLINLTSCNTKEFEDKSKGLYENYINAAIKRYEKGNNKKGIKRYGNVIAEYINTTKQMAQTNDDANILTFVVLLIYEEKNGNVAKNYLCQVSKGEFAKIVKKNTPKKTKFVDTMIEESNKIKAKRTKIGSIEYDANGNIELDGVGVGFGVKTDIGKIADAGLDEAYGAAAGLEAIFNDLRNKKIKENQIINNMNDATYLYSINMFSQYIYEDNGIVATEISFDELKKNNYLDKDEIKAYEKLLSDFGCIKSENSQDIKKDTRNEYEKYLENNGIEKKPKNGYNDTNKIKFYSRYKFEKPSYLKPFCEYNKNNDNIDLLGYTANLNNKDNVVLLVFDDDNTHTSDIEEIVNEFAKKLGCDDYFKKIGEAISVDNNNINAKLYKLMSENFYSEIIKFDSSDINTTIYMLIIEYLDGKIEYKEDFAEIYNEISEIEETSKIDSKNEILKKHDEPLKENIKKYFVDKGFVNIKEIPKYDVSDNKYLNKIICSAI